MPPIYRIISMAGVFFILYFGQKNVLGTGWQAWSIASFTTFLVCFVKLSVNPPAPQSSLTRCTRRRSLGTALSPCYRRRGNEADEVKVKKTPVAALKVKHLSFTYPDGKKILDDISFSRKRARSSASPAQSHAANQRSARRFLCEYPYEGHITVDGAELQNMEQSVRTGIVGYLGHDPELFNDSVETTFCSATAKAAIRI